MNRTLYLSFMASQLGLVVQLMSKSTKWHLQYKIMPFRTLIAFKRKCITTHFDIKMYMKLFTVFPTNLLKFRNLFKKNTFFNPTGSGTILEYVHSHMEQGFKPNIKVMGGFKRYYNRQGNGRIRHSCYLKISFVLLYL